MNVEKYDPTSTLPVEFTDSAVDHLIKQVTQKSAQGILFNVREAGCSGFKYLLELAFDVSDQTLRFQLTKGLTLYVSERVISLIRGTRVDYVKEGVNYRLVFSNPNATASCGCGESFSVEQQQ